MPAQLSVPDTTLPVNLARAAQRHPHKPCLVFHGHVTTYGQAWQQVQALAGWLQHDAGVQRGDRVLLWMHNSPQYVLAYYAVLLADAVVVPLNPMLTADELRHVALDTQARVIVASQALFALLQPLLDEGPLQQALIACYADALPARPEPPAPGFVRAPRQPLPQPGASAWADVLSLARTPRPSTAEPGDLCLLAYTSGSTGQPKACMHSHRNVMITAVVRTQWQRTTGDDVFLATLPLCHVTGMQGSMNAPLFLGATVVLMARWDALLAAQLVQRHRITSWQAISTMMVDLLAHPRLDEMDLGSLVHLSGGGAPMPAAVAQRLAAMGLSYVEAYGLSETMAPTHMNPPQRPKAQCLGIPLPGVSAWVVDPGSGHPVPAGDVGELWIAAPQLMQGYWRQPEATAQAIVERSGLRLLRTGDLGYVDDDGYFFLVDRLKRMVNSAGFKVWPAEVESVLAGHPAVQEVCVVGMPDARRGQAVKALVVLRPPARGETDAAQLIGWCRARLAAYKLPRVVEFVDALPRSGSGKVMWRALQEREGG